MATSSKKNLRLGNCLVGALYLTYKLWPAKITMLWRGRTIPHFYVIDANGAKWHFKVVEDVFPDPFCYLVFLGRFERLLA